MSNQQNTPFDFKNVLTLLEQTLKYNRSYDMNNIKKLTWLHLSDIHFKFTNFNTMRMRDMLIKKIEELSKINSFSFIVVSGDLSFKGEIDKKGLEDFFDNILKRTSLEKTNLFIVPGNHDVHRYTPRTLALKTLLSDPHSDIDSETEEFLLKDFTKFNNFYKDYIGKDYPCENVHWVHIDKDYNLVGINTAITCGSDKEEGKLKIDSSRLFKALKQIENSSSLNIALGHHGIDCFCQSEQNNTINQFEDYGIDLYLCGHVHKVNYTVSSDGNRNIPTITCGSAVVDDYSTAYFVVESYDGQNCSAKYFCWEKDIQQWIVDNSVTRKLDDNGFLYFPIKERLGENEEYIDIDAFQEFIINFHNNINLPREQNSSILPKDISEKFVNMRCNKSMVSQYDKLSLYFSNISHIMNSPAFMSPVDKLAIPNVIIEAYNNNFDKFDSGHKILEAMINDINREYTNKFEYPESTLKLYIKILCYWIIYECDIFDDKKE